MQSTKKGVTRLLQDAQIPRIPTYTCLPHNHLKNWQQSFTTTSHFFEIRLSNSSEKISFHDRSFHLLCILGTLFLVAILLVPRPFSGEVTRYPLGQMVTSHFTPKSVCPSYLAPTLESLYRKNSCISRTPNFQA